MTGASGFFTYLPASLVRAAAGRRDAEPPSVAAVDGTMVMADLSGFTPLTERLAALGDEGAERLTGIINDFFERMLTTAAGYGGDTLTFGGDAILSLFDGVGHQSRAVAAALAMLRGVQRTAAVDAGDGRGRSACQSGRKAETSISPSPGFPAGTSTISSSAAAPR